MMVFDELRELSRHRYVSAYDVAMIHVALEDRDAAFEWLNKAWEQHDLQLVSLKVDPSLDGVRADPRFGELVRRVGLPQ